MPAKTTGFKTTLRFESSAWECDIVGVSGDGISRAAIDVTHMGSTEPGEGEYGGEEFIPADLANPGTIKVDVLFDPNKFPPVMAPAEIIEASFKAPPGSPVRPKMRGVGFITDFSWSAGLRDKKTGTLTLKKTGVWKAAGGATQTAVGSTTPETSV